VIKGYEGIQSVCGLLKCEISGLKLIRFFEGTPPMMMYSNCHAAIYRYYKITII